jgi:dTDP-4-amino-4,6-dideoxygalactose transaminase
MYRIGKEEIEAVTRVIESKQLFKVNNGNREVEHFQTEMQEKFDVKHALLMSSGHAALVSALIAMGVGPGDEVIVPAYTYIATAMAVLQVGAIPVIGEIDETLTLCPIDVEKKITKHTKVILPVHIQGLPSNMDAICAVAKKHGVMVLEDSCQADGGSYKGRRLGTIGDAGAYSFNYYKIMTAGEGGALVTNDSLLHQKALIYHDSSAVAFFGKQLDGSVPTFCGTEFRTNEITGAILREQLKRVDGILGDLRRVKKTIMDALKDDYKFNPSNDIDGDCATTLTFLFDTVEEAKAFELVEGIRGVGGRPIDAAKHVYNNWMPVMEKRGALNPKMDPFKMEANKDIIPDYTNDMCKKSLDILSRTVLLGLNPDMTGEEIEKLISLLKKAKA